MLLGFRSLFERYTGVSSSQQPVIRSIASSAGVTGTETNVCPKPAGVAVGDYLIAYQTADNDNDYATMAAPTVTGTWALLLGNTTTQGQNIPYVKIYGKVANAQDVAATQYTFIDGLAGTATASDTDIIIIAVQAGTYDTVAPTSFGTWTTSPRVNAGSGVALQQAASMAADAGDLLLAFYGTDANGVVQTHPATNNQGMTLVRSQTGAGGYAFTGIYSQQVATTGATGVKTMTPTGTTTSNGWAAVQMVVNGTTVNIPNTAANAGADASVNLGSAFSRTGTFAGSPTAFAWKVSEGPANVGDTIATAAAVNWTPTVAGTYVLTFFATNAGGTSFDQMILTVAAANPPTVNVGTPNPATSNVNTAFSRTATESGAVATSRAWTLFSGPAGAPGIGTTLSTTTAFTYTPDRVGTYVFRFTATNGAGSTPADLTVTVVGPPIVSVGTPNPATPIANRTQFIRTAVETGGGGVTSRAWSIVSGPVASGVVATTQTLTYTPTLPGTYVFSYSATNPQGTSNTDTLSLTVTAVTIGLSASDSAISTPTGNLAVRKLYRESKTEQAVSTPTGNLRVIRIVRSTSQSVSDTIGGKPRVVTGLRKTEQATSPATGSLAIRRLYRESKVEQAVSTTIGNLRRIRTLASTSIETTPTTTSKLTTARQIASTSGSVSSNVAKLFLVRKIASTSTTISSGTPRLSLVTRYSVTVFAESRLQPANLQQPTSLRASATSNATGALSKIVRLSKTEQAVSTTTGRPVTTRRLTSQIDSLSTTANARLRRTQMLSEVVQAWAIIPIETRLILLDHIVDGVITARSSILDVDAIGRVQIMTSASSSLSDVPFPQLRRAVRLRKTEQAVSTTAAVFYRITFVKSSSSSFSSVPLSKLVRMRELIAPDYVAGMSSVVGRKLGRVTPFFPNIRQVSAPRGSVRVTTKFVIRVDALSRSAERGGYAVLTTAKAVTTSPRNRARQVRVLEGYTTSQTTATADIVRFRALGYSRADSTARGKIRKLVRMTSRAASISSHPKANLRAIGPLSTVIRVFQDEEYEAYISNENYTGSAPVGVSAPEPEEAPIVFRRAFMRPR